MMDCLWITLDQNRIGDINISFYSLFSFTTHVSASSFFPLVFLIPVGLNHLSWKQETCKMSLVTLKRLSPSIGVWMKVDGLWLLCTKCSGYSASDVLASMIPLDGFRVVGWGGVVSIVACLSVLCRIFPEVLSIATKTSIIADCVTAGHLTRHFQNACQKYYLYRKKLSGGVTEESRVDAGGKPGINCENLSICDGATSGIRFCSFCRGTLQSICTKSWWFW
jgi:hypothetical protein